MGHPAGSFCHVTKSRRIGRLLKKFFLQPNTSIEFQTYWTTDIRRKINNSVSRCENRYPMLKLIFFFVHKARTSQDFEAWIDHLKQHRLYYQYKYTQQYSPQVSSNNRTQNFAGNNSNLTNNATQPVSILNQNQNQPPRFKQQTNINVIFLNNYTRFIKL